MPSLTTLTCKFAWQGWQRSAVKHRHNNGQHDCYQIHYFVFFKLLAYTSTGTLRHSASCMDIHSSSHPCTCQQICPTATASQTVKGRAGDPTAAKTGTDGHSNMGRVKLSRDRMQDLRNHLNNLGVLYDTKCNDMVPIIKQRQQATCIRLRTWSDNWI